jgi:ABC-2 type transport system permease protein
MRSFWLVAKHAYRSTVVRRGFVILTAAIPLGMVALVTLGILAAGMGVDDRPIGYADRSGTLDPGLHTTLPGAASRVQVRAFPDEDAARVALEREEIQAFFVLPADYPQTLETDLYFLDSPPSEEAWGDFDDFVRINLVSAMPEEVRDRLLKEPDITVHDVASGREFGKSSIINVVLPFVATFFFFFATMSAAGYMLSVVAGEKENRTIEIMVSSVTPAQLIGGKTAGLLAAALTQLAIYVLAAIVGLRVAVSYVPELQQIAVPWAYLGVVALFFLPTYALISAVMVAIGAAVTELQQGQQMAGLLNLFFMLPILLLPVLLENPGSPIIVFFTLFPTSSFLTISLRWGLGTVPLWQIGVAWVLLVAAAIGMVWAATRVFRAGMVRYGQPLSFKAALAVIRGR